MSRERRWQDGTRSTAAPVQHQEAAIQPNTWTKSSRSSSAPGAALCVEVGVIDRETRAIRSSRFPDEWLLLTRRQLRSLFDAIKAR
ncbi:DUF397 domain-containing protein [Actinomadura opuntiae]|uniref:DUF397 domain-containing protein n=1 Tax=Actinomadura sp. OS1-43 TaxID=604315 RepID=UPI00255A9741|nr:DUF397 domain-containing protein [Actinomadura sp. OS1-43]MDL4812838.1 DUF397 domain-containing protein [Actinomadura sp. OS1-43]